MWVGTILNSVVMAQRTMKKPGDEYRESWDDGQIYRVLVNSFMYAGGDEYDMIAHANPDGFDTGINYRRPFQDWLKSQESSVDNPPD